jgi:hypothetical protein
VKAATSFPYCHPTVPTSYLQFPEARIITSAALGGALRVQAEVAPPVILRHLSPPAHLLAGRNPPVLSCSEGLGRVNPLSVHWNAKVGFWAPSGANTQLIAAQKKLGEVTSDVEHLKSELQEKQSRLDALQSDITGATQASDQAKSEVAKANDQTNAIQSKLDQANAEIERLKTQLTEARAVLSKEGPQPVPSESPEAQPPAEVAPTPTPAPSPDGQ